MEVIIIIEFLVSTAFIAFLVAKLRSKNDQLYSKEQSLKHLRKSVGDMNFLMRHGWSLRKKDGEVLATVDEGDFELWLAIKRQELLNDLEELKKEMVEVTQGLETIENNEMPFNEIQQISDK